MISHSDMRQADINRVKKAREHLKAATTLLNNIKWENVDGMEDLLMIQSKSSISDADRSLDHITKIQTQRNEKDHGNNIRHRKESQSFGTC